jgi:hypothetical protein
MLVRINTVMMFGLLTLAVAARAEGLAPIGAADPRQAFLRACVAQLGGRWEHPESVCGCLHDHAAAAVEDRDLRQALLRGISETGVPTIESDWVPAAKQAEIGVIFNQIARPTLQCLFEPLR